MAIITKGLGITGPKAKALTSYIVDMYDGLPHHMRGGSSATKVGALMYIAGKYGVEEMSGIRVTHSDLSTLLGVSDVAIRANRKNIEGHMRELYRAEGVDVDRLLDSNKTKIGPKKAVVKERVPVSGPEAKRPAPPGYLQSELDHIMSRLALGDEARGGVYKVYCMLADRRNAPRAESKILRAASIVYAGCKITPGYDMSIKEFSGKVGLGQSSIFGTYRKIYESVPKIEELVKAAMK